MKNKSLGFGCGLLLLGAFTAVAAPKKVTGIQPADLKFTYESLAEDPTPDLPCTSALTQADDPYDFTVKCFDQGVLKKTLNVHFAISKYTHPTAPKTVLEILYWINSDGPSTLLSFPDDVTPSELNTAVSLPGESAELRLRISIGNGI